MKPPTRMKVTAVLLTLPMLSNTASSDVLVDRTPPSFTAQEVVMILEHEPLATAAKSDPWMLRRMMDAAARNSTEADQDGNQDGEKASPEAAHDLFQLLKKLQAGSGDVQR